MGKAMMALGRTLVPEARETVEMMYEFNLAVCYSFSSKFEKTFGMRATPVHEAIREDCSLVQGTPRTCIAMLHRSTRTGTRRTLVLFPV